MDIWPQFLRLHPLKVHDRVNIEMEVLHTEGVQVMGTTTPLLHAPYLRYLTRHCKPGGYFEIQELDPRFLCDDESLKTEAVQNSWSKMMCEASAEYNRPVPLHTDYKAWMEEAGFVDVKEYFLKLPTNDWPKNKQLKEIGKFQLAHLTEGLFSLTIGLFTRVLHWSAAEVQVLLAKMRAEVKDRRIHSYEIVYVASIDNGR